MSIESHLQTTWNLSVDIKSEYWVTPTNYLELVSGYKKWVLSHTYKLPGTCQWLWKVSMLAIGWVYGWWFRLTQVIQEIIDKVRKIWSTNRHPNQFYFSLVNYCNKSVMVWNESVNSEDQLFHQYQQSKQSSVTSTHWTQTKPTTYDIGNPGLGSGTGTKKVSALNKDGVFF